MNTFIQQEHIQLIKMDIKVNCFVFYFIFNVIYCYKRLFYLLHLKNILQKYQTALNSVNNIKCFMSSSKPEY